MTQTTRQKIIRPDAEKPVFLLSWDGVRDSNLQLNFLPVIECVNEKMGHNFSLLHWQAKPRNYRRFGVYDGKNNQYYGVDDFNLYIDCCIHSVCQVDESKFTTVPTAVIYYPNSIVDSSKLPFITISREEIWI